MTQQYLVRFGRLGFVAPLQGDGRGTEYPRNSRVVCRTPRGTEVGQVLCDHTSVEQADGQIIRGITLEDDLLLARMEKNQNEAFEACQQLMLEAKLDQTLMDVELLFDGQGLFFYFLGDVTPELETITSALAERYETYVQFRKFTETLEQGCGPDCGTESAQGCSTGCSSCAIAAHCATGR